MNVQPQRRRRIALAAIAAFAFGAALCAVATHKPTSRATPAPPTTAVVLHQTGTGSTVTPMFSTGQDWAIDYTFTCTHGTTLRMIERGAVADGVALVDRAETTGSGTTYAADEPGTHRVEIYTTCQWTITVENGDTMPRATR